MIVCQCMQISKKEIINFLKKHPYATIQQVAKHTRASTQCGRCRPLLLNIYNEHLKKTPPNNQQTLQF